jgi:hypothetical protein
VRTQRSLLKNAAILVTGLALTGCVYIFSPQTITEYDEACNDVFRQMKLTVEQQAILPAGGCTNQADCIGLLGVVALVTPLSAIVSGSIFLVGNTVFWLEKQRRCAAREHAANVSPN